MSSAPTSSSPTTPASAAHEGPGESFFGVEPQESVDGEAFRTRVEAATATARRFEKSHRAPQSQIDIQADKTGSRLRLNVNVHDLDEGTSTQTILPGNGKFYLAEGRDKFLEMPPSEVNPDQQTKIDDSSDPTHIPDQDFWKDSSPLTYLGSEPTTTGTVHMFGVFEGDRMVQQAGVDERYRLRWLTLVGDGGVQEDHVTELEYPEMITIITPPPENVAN